MKLFWFVQIHIIIVSITKTVSTIILSSSTEDTRTTTTTTATTTDRINDSGDDEFFMACSKGNVDLVQQYIVNDASYVTKYSKNGETCLHVAAILGQSTITKYILQQSNSLPNQRSIYQHGLRMTPLSWNVYGLHIPNIELLLQYNANVNLDFDYIVTTKKTTTATTTMNDNVYEKVTPLDLVYIMAGTTISLDDDDDENENDTDHENEYVKKLRLVRDILVQHGGKRFIDLQQQQHNEL